MSTKESFYRPVSLESVIPAIFDEVGIYIKNASMNYVLYKSPERPVNEYELAKLRKNGNEFVYVRTGDMEAINAQLEDNLADTLADPALTSDVKGKILYQCAINYVAELFDKPAAASDIERCRKLVDNIINFITSDPHSMEALIRIAEHNGYIYVHSLQVAALSIIVHSHNYRLQRDEMIDVGIGALLHDFGCIYVPQNVMTNIGSFSPAEAAAFRRHTEDGYEHMKNIGKYNDVTLTIIRYHHEKADGTGYPVGIRKHEIPRSAQITSICDMYCTLTSSKINRQPLEPAEAIRAMRTEYASHYNQDMVDKLARAVLGRD